MPKAQIQIKTWILRLWFHKETVGPWRRFDVSMFPSTSVYSQLLLCLCFGEEETHFHSGRQ